MKSALTTIGGAVSFNGVCKRIADLTVDGDANDLYFDRERRHVHVIFGEGAIDVVWRQDADHYELVDNVPTARGARTGLSPAQRKALYIAVPVRGRLSAEIRAYAVR